MYLEHFSAACPASLRHSVCSGSLRGRERSNLTEKCSRTSKWLLAKPSSASTESGSKRGQMQSADSPISCPACRLRSVRSQSIYHKAQGARAQAYNAPAAMRSECGRRPAVTGKQIQRIEDEVDRHARRRHQNQKRLSDSSRMQHNAPKRPWRCLQEIASWPGKRDPHAMPAGIAQFVECNGHRFCITK